MSELNITAAANALGVKVAEIRLWRDEGMPFVNYGAEHKHRYIISDIFKWHQNSIKSGAEVSMSATEAKRRREVALALKAELDLAKEREQLVVIDDVMAEFVAALVKVRAGLIGQAPRLSGLLAHQDEDKITELLNDDVTSILENLSNYKHEYGNN
ncbi:putative DNA-binding domain protein [Vibrio phage 2.096.O._10N.286.48.B5]|nr:putative DNA-binding domain protein [Vibrio phage 2.096.O._10N.286.48.B5]